MTVFPISMGEVDLSDSCLLIQEFELVMLRYMTSNDMWRKMTEVLDFVLQFICLGWMPWNIIDFYHGDIFLVFPNNLIHWILIYLWWKNWVGFELLAIPLPFHNSESEAFGLYVNVVLFSMGGLKIELVKYQESIISLKWYCYLIYVGGMKIELMKYQDNILSFK